MNSIVNPWLKIKIILYYFISEIGYKKIFLNWVNFRSFKIGSLSHITSLVYVCIISEMGSFEVILERAYVIMPETGRTKVWPPLSGYDLADRDGHGVTSLPEVMTRMHRRMVVSILWSDGGICEIGICTLNVWINCQLG